MYDVIVEKKTDEGLMREACESTFIGTSKQSLLQIYKSEHSPARTQMFWIQLKNIPLFVSTHLLRHHVGSQPFALTMRDDLKHGGKDNLDVLTDKCLSLIPGSGCISEIEAAELLDTLKEIKEKCGRNNPTNLSLFINAQSLIDMSKQRLCCKAHKETYAVFALIKSEIEKVDAPLHDLMVRKCIYRNGVCGETKPCGFMNTEAFEEELQEYQANYNKNQVFHAFNINNFLNN